MRIAYVVNTRIPTEKAHGYQIVRVCSELARLGHEVVLYIPARANTIGQDPFEYYGIGQNFRIERVPCFDAMRFVGLLGPLAFWLTTRSFLRRLTLSADEVVYTRDADAVAYLSKRGLRCIYNAHNWAASRTRRIKRARGVVCNSHATEAAVKKATGLPTVVAPNATDPNPYAGAPKPALRRELGLPERPLALYAGHLYKWKGGSVLVEAATLMPDVQFVVIGGTAETNVKNVLFLGLKPKVEVPKYLAAADVLLLPNTAEGESEFTSPLKLFEYMASGTPIVASDLPAIREILSAKNAVLVEAGSPRALVEGIARALSVGTPLAQAAFAESRIYTWSAHAEKVSEFMKFVCRPTT